MEPEFLILLGGALLSSLKAESVHISVISSCCTMGTIVICIEWASINI